MSLLVSACGDSGSEPPASSSADTAPSVTAPPAAATPSVTPTVEPTVTPPTANLQSPSVTLSGTPAASVRVGQAYSFAPTATSYGTGYAYSVANKPSWASFDTVTGRLHGTPTADHAGSYRGVSISITNGIASASLPSFAIEVLPSAVTTGGQASLSWQTPTQNDDGSALVDLGGFRIYFGAKAETLDQVIDVPNPQAVSYVVKNLSLGTYYFAMTAYNNAGVESDRSAVTSKSVM